MLFRSLQDASGYRAVIVDGETVLKDDQLTGKNPGRLYRAGQQALESAA